MLWGLDPRHWLSAFFYACAANGGKTPADLHAFLPWQMSDERKDELAQPEPVAWASSLTCQQAEAAPAEHDTS